VVKEIGNRISRLRALAIGFLVSSSPLALGAGTAHGAAQVGTSAAVQGDVFVRGAGAQERAKLNQQISLGDEVLTKQQSALQILLLDASIFTVGENCNMTIDRFVYDPDSGAGEMAATVAKGAFRFMSGRIGGNNPTNVTLQTPTATIGVRGTFVDSVVGEDALAIARKLCGPNHDGAGTGASSEARSCMCGGQNADPNGASLVVLRGPGSGRQSFDRKGALTVQNQAGSASIGEANFAIFVPSATQAPCGPFPLPDDLRDYLDFFLRSTPDGPPVDPIDEIDDDEDTEPPVTPPEFGKEDPSILDTEEPPPPPPYFGQDS
jgi:hypothetical protein